MVLNSLLAMQSGAADVLLCSELCGVWKEILPICSHIVCSTICVLFFHQQASLISVANRKPKQNLNNLCLV